MIDRNDPRLSAFVLGELDEAEAEEIRAAIEQSAELKKAVDEIEQTSRLVGDLLQKEPLPALTAEQRNRLIDEQVDKQVDEPAKPVSKEQPAPPAREIPWARFVAIAACLMLVAAYSTTGRPAIAPERMHAPRPSPARSALRGLFPWKTSSIATIDGW